MTQAQRKNGSLELRFNEDRSQVTATIYPPTAGGVSIEVTEVLERLKNLGVTYGIRQQVILEAIHDVSRTESVVSNVVVAQGVLAEDGTDGKIRYNFPVELLMKPLPQGPGNLIDWFAIDPEKLVQADQEIAVIVPPLAGMPGKTLTWPVQMILPRAGKPASITAGTNVRMSDDNLRLLSSADGYVCLHNDVLTVHALRVVPQIVSGGTLDFPNGAVFLEELRQAQVRAGGFIAVRGLAEDCRLRSHGDIIVRSARNCTLIAQGTVYVLEQLHNCQVNTPGKIIGFPGSRLVGGSLCAKGGVEADTLGAPDFTATEVIVAVDRFSSVRETEIEEELTECEANIGRISQALKPFATLAVHTNLTEERRLLLQKLQTQKRAQEERINELHSSRRSLMLAGKVRLTARVRSVGVTHPGVWVSIGSAAMQVESPLEQVEFVEAAGGKTVQAVPVAKAA